MNIDFPATKRELSRYLPSKKREPQLKIDFVALRENPSLQARLIEELENDLGGLEDTQDIDTLNSNIVDSVQGCVNKVCPKVQSEGKKEP